MPFAIVRNDITHMQVDAIVNTANPRPVVGAGTDAAVHGAAGPGLLEARKTIGAIAVGKAAITPGFALPAKYVIHTVGPMWRGGLLGEAKLLRSCYETSLALAAEYGCRSVAFPLISSGSYGYPKEKALQIAISAFQSFLLEREMQIYLVVYDQLSFHLSEKLVEHVKSYIDQNYVEAFHPAAFQELAERSVHYGEEPEYFTRRAMLCPTMAAPSTASKQQSLKELLRQADAGFTETLLQLIDASGKKDSVIYKKANISKQHFSKIRNNPQYKPNKSTAIALALALELNVEQTNDLIGRAGYTLSNSSKFDLIIRYFIEQRNFNMMEINMTLYEFDQNLLGV